MGANRRYAAQIDQMQDARLAASPLGPLTLPLQAYGPRPIDWSGARPPVWVWVHFPDMQPAERRKGYVKGANDRVCCVWVDGPGGGWEIVVWRNAVTHRQPDRPSPTIRS